MKARHEEGIHPARLYGARGESLSSVARQLVPTCIQLNLCRSSWVLQAVHAVQEQLLRSKW